MGCCHSKAKLKSKERHEIRTHGRVRWTNRNQERLYLYYFTPLRNEHVIRTLTTHSPHSSLQQDDTTTPHSDVNHTAFTHI